MASHLSKELRQKHNKRSITLRKGDKIKILRGNFKGKSGVVERVVSKRDKVYVNGIEVIKKDGTKQLVPLRPSNLLITQLNLDDKKRKLKLENKDDKK
jgi:large subunit ribosomal protein L24